MKTQLGSTFFSVCVFLLLLLLSLINNKRKNSKYTCWRQAMCMCVCECLCVHVSDLWLSMRKSCCCQKNGSLLAPKQHKHRMQLACCSAGQDNNNNNKSNKINFFACNRLPAGRLRPKVGKLCQITSSYNTFFWGLLFKWLARRTRSLISLFLHLSPSFPLSLSLSISVCLPLCFSPSLKEPQKVFITLNLSSGAAAASFVRSHQQRSALTFH